MSPSPPARAQKSCATLAVGLVAALAVVGLLAVPTPASAAVATPPWFGPNVPVTALPAYSSYQPSMAIDGSGVLYLAFAGWGGSTTQADIFFTKSFDGARTWSAPIRVNNDAGGALQQEPSIFVDHNRAIYIAWTDYRIGAADVYFSKSTDLGLSFSANVRVNDVTANAQSQPDLAVDSTGLVHVVWTDLRNVPGTGPDIYYANSTDGGLSFNPNLRVNNDGGAIEQGEPAIAVGTDRSVYVVWTDPRNGARGFDIYFSKSTDLGGTWAPNFYLNDDTGGRAQTAPDIVVDGASTVYVAWSDSRDTNTGPDIFATRSSNAGSSFSANAKVNNEAGSVYQGSPSLTANAGVVYAAWSDERTRGSTSRDIYEASSPDGANWNSNVRVSDDNLPSNFQDNPTIAVDGFGDVYAAWFDQRWSGQDVYTATLDAVAPVANPGTGTTVDQGATVPFDGSASTDNLAIASYAWNFGDGTSATGPVGSHAYPVPGTYTVTLTVTDRSGNMGSASLTMTVRDTIAPTVRGFGDRTVDEGQALFFDATASTDNVGVASYAWDFGDGMTSTQAGVTHVYAVPGTYSGSVTVTDAAGNSQTATFTVTVRTVSPKAGELLGQIATLNWIVAILAVGFAILALLAFLQWRRREKPQTPPMPWMHQPPPQGPPPPPPPPF